MKLPDMSVIDTHLPSNTKIRGFTTEQMLAWGKACAEAERETCAKLCRRPWQGLTDEEVAIASAEFDTKLKLAFHAGMYKAQIILRKKNDPTY